MDQGADIRKWLHDRGIENGSIKKARIGWNPKDEFRLRKEWGLPSVKSDKTGKVKKLWLPEGLVIPCFVNKKLIRLRVRRSSHKENGSRYIIIPGSDSTSMVWMSKLKAVVIVESELDGILVNQQAGDLVSTIALGSAQARPDKSIDQALNQSGVILLCLDADSAGGKESQVWWKAHYKQSKRWWATEVGKDPGEAYQNGLDIRSWIEGGLPYYQTSVAGVEQCEKQNLKIKQTGKILTDHEFAKDAYARQKTSKQCTISPSATAKVDAIKDQAMALGWSKKRLYQNYGRFRFPCGEGYGLICFIENNKQIGKVTEQYIEIIGPHPRNIVQRFYNPDVE